MSDLDEPTVKISWRDIYVEVQRQGKLLDKMVNNHKILEDHEVRLRRLETRVGWGVGIALAVASLVGATVAIIS
jgi:hypothetical protein